MNAAEVLKAICKSGLAEGSIYVGGTILDANFKILEGKVYPKKEYYYSFKQLNLVHSAMVKTNQGAIVYLYKL